MKKLTIRKKLCGFFLLNSFVYIVYLCVIIIIRMTEAISWRIYFTPEEALVKFTVILWGTFLQSLRFHYFQYIILRMFYSRKFTTFSYKYSQRKSFKLVRIFEEIPKGKSNVRAISSSSNCINLFLVEILRSYVSAEYWNGIVSTIYCLKYIQIYYSANEVPFFQNIFFFSLKN